MRVPPQGLKGGVYTWGPPYLQLLDPGAVPVGEPDPLDEELALGTTLQRLGGPLGGGPGGGGHRGGRLPPSPVQDLLYSPLQHRALRG